jgi:hypothetical protein
LVRHADWWGGGPERYSKRGRSTVGKAQGASTKGFNCNLSTIPCKIASLCRLALAWNISNHQLRTSNEEIATIDPKRIGNHGAVGDRHLALECKIPSRSLNSPASCPSRHTLGAKDNPSQSTAEHEFHTEAKRAPSPEAENSCWIYGNVCKSKINSNIDIHPIGEGEGVLLRPFNGNSAN